MPPTRRTIPTKTAHQMPDYALNRAINRIQATAQDAAVKRQEIEDWKPEEGEGWDDQDIEEELK